MADFDIPINIACRNNMISNIVSFVNHVMAFGSLNQNFEENDDYLSQKLCFFGDKRIK